jgi:hypothetical protein
MNKLRKKRKNETVLRIEKISFTDTKHMKTYLDLSVNRPDSSANKPGSLRDTGLVGEYAGLVEL